MELRGTTEISDNSLWVCHNERLLSHYMLLIIVNIDNVNDAALTKKSYKYLKTKLKDKHSKD